MITPNTATLMTALTSRKLTLFGAKGFDLNIIGLRAMPGRVNAFDDMLCVLYRDTAGMWCSDAYPCTTDPGAYWLEHPQRRSGTAILMPGQHRGAFKMGRHHDEYPCLVQAKALPVWRDSDRDVQLDYGGPEGEAEQIQIHRANATRASTAVDKWSAGCQVIADPVCFGRFMELCKAQIAHGHGETFSYTLLEWPVA